VIQEAVEMLNEEGITAKASFRSAGWFPLHGERLVEI